MLQVVLVDGTIWEKMDSLGTMVAKRVRMVCTGITPVGATGSRSPKSQEKHSKECSAEYYPIWRMTITLVSVERVGTGFAVDDEWHYVQERCSANFLVNETRNMFSDTPPVAAPFRESVPISLGDIQGFQLSTTKRKECGGGEEGMRTRF